jgi:hypothetical protein
MRTGLLIAWLAVTLFGLTLVGWAIEFYFRVGGSYLAIPEIAGFVGSYICYQGISNMRRISKTRPPG